VTAPARRVDAQRRKLIEFLLSDATPSNDAGEFARLIEALARAVVGELVEDLDETLAEVRAIAAAAGAGS
jgi:hypothetical protein